MEPSPSTLALRPFGRAEDLDLEFGGTARPDLVTAILARCGETSDAQFWWSQPVGARIAALLRLLAVTDACDSLPLRSRCAEPGCSELFEFALPIAALAGQAPGAEPVEVRLGGERSVTMRRPTGQDLRDWHVARPASRREALAVMLDTLCVAGRAAPEDEAALADAIAAQDPLVGFTVACQCPVCHAGHELPIDLEAMVLARLEARQRQLLWDVHRLASRYGWTESEVLAVAPSRRARYLELIENGR